METKICAKCKEEKPVTEFAFRNLARGIRNTRCRSCQSEYCKAHYQKHKKGHNTRRQINQRGYERENKKWICEYLTKHPCLVCGETNIILLEFDHLRDKKQCVSQMVSRCGLEAIKKEVAKCEVKCVRCHRLKTAKDGDWYTYRFLEENKK